MASIVLYLYTHYHKMLLISLSNYVVIFSQVTVCQILLQPVIDTLSGHMCLKPCVCVYKALIVNLVMYR